MVELYRWKCMLRHDFPEVQQREQDYLFSRIRYDLKLQEVGHHCCQAAEQLTDSQLRVLHEALACSAEQWRTYYGYVRPSPEDPLDRGEPSGWLE